MTDDVASRIVKAIRAEEDVVKVMLEKHPGDVRFTGWLMGLERARATAEWLVPDTEREG